MTSNAVLDRVVNLESAVFGGLPVALTLGLARLQSLSIPLSGSDDALTIFGGVYVVTSTGVNAMTLAVPLAGGPGIGQDGQIIIILDASGHPHTVTVPLANTINGNKHVVTFNGTIAAFVSLFAFNGVFYVLANSGVSLS